MKIKTHISCKKNRSIVSMGEMKPFDIGVIISSSNSIYKGNIVMRTGSDEHFEVMRLTGDYKNEADYWEADNPTILDHKVELFEAGESIVLTVINHEE